jgi:hypothetical protein
MKNSRRHEKRLDGLLKSFTVGPSTFWHPRLGFLV